MSSIDYKAEVRKVYPDAACVNIDYGFGVFGSTKDVNNWRAIGVSKFENASKENAWKSAYDNLKQQGKL